MNLDLGGADAQLRDWVIAFVICMVVMFWRRIFRLADAEPANGGAERSVETAQSPQTVEARVDASTLH